MVLTKEELISSLQNEVRILVHLAGKIDPAQIDYRPTPKQRSFIELLRYLSIMGPGLIPAIKTGTFDGAAFGAAAATAAKLDLAGVIASIGTQSALYAETLGAFTEADFRGEIDMFGSKRSRGAHIVFLVLGGFAAYRTQLFLYLKACGREELSTMNLWGGMDAPVQA
ncbi:MAG TPA: hypothetical protein VGN17_28240 [Bryobacteraceae bacterium]|jgi:hypothetical protein